MDLLEDISVCVERNIHNRTKEEIEKVTPAVKIICSLTHSNNLVGYEV